MNDQELCERILQRVGDRADAQVTVSRGPEALTRFANSFIHQNVAEEAVAVALTVAVGGRTATATSTRTAPDAADDLVDRALEAAALRPVDPLWPGMAPPAPVPDVHHFDPETAEADPTRRARLVRDFVDAGPGLLAAGFCRTEAGAITFANNAGQRCAGAGTRAILDGIHQTPSSAGSAHQTSQRISELSGVEAGTEAAGKARDGVDPVEVKPGEYTVVLEPDAVGTIFMFLAMYGFNAQAAIEQRSFVQIGERQIDEGITLIDDVTDPRALGVAFDAEGTPKRRVPLIGAGVPQTFVHDRRTAGQMATESTGHAVPGGAGFGAFPTNMFVVPGTESRDGLIAGVDRGLLVTQFNYCRVLDPRTLAVTGLTRNGTFLIENGRVSGPVANLRFTQSFVEALAPGAVTGVGSDARFAMSEFGPGFVHVPSLRLAAWNFTGGGQG